jgi:hypothetical protein
MFVAEEKEGILKAWKMHTERQKEIEWVLITWWEAAASAHSFRF